MKPVTDQDIRNSFVNCSKGEAKRLNLPRDLAELPWADLDFLGWRDPGAPDRSYLVLERDGGLTGLSLRFSAQYRGYLRSNICSLCLTVHSGSGVALLTARKAGAAGREGNSVGAYMCTDLACPLYIRGSRQPQGTGGRIEESLTVEQQIARLHANLDAFLVKVLA
ncbi:FBP domain-containing protein [Kitasatospora viridis]|uniref:Treble-clef zinc-finger protein n=1 Tax=Kitasatospora viridis TaxID=281105 RepID=A0A561UGY5_9ACTN|nr:FBP domain-containing protein [Kitasatospora viridis]TWF98616.1 treble-clef zinc-finger protein [Kitasatospora viridis]